VPIIRLPGHVHPVFRNLEPALLIERFATSLSLLAAIVSCV
jgi:hypothetical protein